MTKRKTNSNIKRVGSEQQFNEVQTQNAELIEQINSLQAARGRMADEYFEEKKELKAQLAKANERVKELEKELANKELLHVGFTNGSQIKYAKVEEGAFYPDTDGDCYIPIYMLKSHEHRIETTSIEQLRKEQEND